MLIFGILVAVVGWLVCGWVAYGLVLGHFTRAFPYSNNSNLRNAAFLFGPAALLVELTHPPYTFRLRHLPLKERWDIYKKMFPYLSSEAGAREEFEREYPQPWF